MKLGKLSEKPRQGGFTLVETMITVVIVFIMVFAAMGAILFSQVQIAKDRERAIISDFAVHYLETLRALPFSDLRAGAPINTLWDGNTTNGWGRKDQILIPSTASWVNLAGTAYESFTPDIVKITNRAPQIRVQLTTTQVAGVDHTKSIQLDLAWDSPLGKGARQEMRIDSVRVKDLQ